MKRFFALLLSLCAAVAGAAGTVVVDSLVASVNGEPVTLSDVREAMPRHLDAARREMSAGRDPNALVRAAFTNALREVEDRRLVVQKYWAGQARLPERQFHHGPVGLVKHGDAPSPRGRARTPF